MNDDHNSLRQESRRLYRPLFLKLVAVVYVLLPFFYYGYFQLVNPARFVFIWENHHLIFGPFGLYLLLLAPLAGLGLLSVTRAGFFGFLAHSILLFFNSGYVLAGNFGSTRSWAYAVVNLVLIGLAVYFLRPNRRYPFLSKEIRGFRREKRV